MSSDLDPAIRHYHAIDVWRTVLLLYGVVVHIAGLHLNSGGLDPLERLPFQLVIASSNGFRMEGFFFLAGFFAARPLLTRRPGYVRERLVKLLVPAATIYALLMPFANAVLGRSAIPDGELYHGWFLITLAEIVVASTLLQNDKIRLFLKHGLSATPAWRIVALVAAYCLAARAIDAAILVNVSPSSFFGATVRSSYYVTFFGLGLLCTARCDLRERLQKSRLSALFPVMLLLFLIAYSAIQLSTPRVDGFDKIVVGTLKVALALSLCITILATMTVALRENRLTRLLSESAFTVYVLNLPILMVAHHYLADAPMMLRLVLELFCAGLGVVIHQLLVVRWHGLQFLLNGGATRRSASPIR